MSSGSAMILTRGVVDASVLVKMFLPEDDSDVATGLLRDLEIRAVPELALAECANIFWTWVRRGRLSRELAWQCFDDLRALPLQVWSMEDVLHDALSLAFEHDVTVYDATYVALARALALPFITADAALVRKLGGPNAELVLLGDLA